MRAPLESGEDLSSLADSFVAPRVTATGPQAESGPQQDVAPQGLVKQYGWCC